MMLSSEVGIYDGSLFGLMTSFVITINYLKAQQMINNGSFGS